MLDERDERHEREREKQGPQELRVVVVQDQRNCRTSNDADGGRDCHCLVGPAQQPSQQPPAAVLSVGRYVAYDQGRQAQAGGHREQRRPRQGVRVRAELLGAEQTGEHEHDDEIDNGRRSVEECRADRPAQQCAITDLEEAGATEPHSSAHPDRIRAVCSSSHCFVRDRRDPGTTGSRVPRAGGSTKRVRFPPQATVRYRLSHVPPPPGTRRGFDRRSCSIRTAAARTGASALGRSARMLPVPG